MRLARPAIFAAALLASSCGAPLMKLPSGPGTPASDAASLLTQATAACSRVSSISTEIAVSGSIGGRRVRGRLLAGLASPGSVYMEAPAPFGAPVFILGATGTDATLLLPRDRRVLEHGRPEQVLEAVAGVPLTPAELEATLTGCLPDRIDAANARSVGSDWRVIEGANTAYLRREKAGQPWRLVSVVRPGTSGWRVDYRNFADDLPRSIRLISNTARRFDLRLDLSQVDLNVTLEPSTFRITIPPGTQPITLDELRENGPLAR